MRRWFARSLCADLSFQPFVDCCLSFFFPPFYFDTIFMKTSYLSIIAFAVASLSIGNALAQDSGYKTRDQVKAELAEAIRTGDIAVGENSLKLNELNPSNYPAKPAFQSKTREQVKAELAEAVRTGDIVVGESGLKRNELFAHQYPAKPVVQGKTRAQVLAELAQAKRTGDIVVHAELGLKENELYPSRYPTAAQWAHQGGTEANAPLADSANAGPRTGNSSL